MRPAPWPHQSDATVQLVCGHWLLLWEMGVGKTGAALLAGEACGGRQLWLTFAILREQALADALVWRPTASVQVVRSTRSLINPDADIVICSYDLMRELSIWKQLYSLRWDSCVCDEGHALAHTDAIRTVAFYGKRPLSKGALYRRCDRVWVLTGTPVLNSPDELFPHLSRLFPHLIPDIPNKDVFLSRFCVLKHRNYGMQVVGGQNLDQLRRILQRCSTREKLDTAKLPPLTVDTHVLEISDEHRRRIEALANEEQLRELDIVLTQIEGGSEAAWQRLNAMLLPLASMRRVNALAKAPGVVEMVDGMLRGGLDRVIVFGLHTEALRWVAHHLQHWKARLLIGDTPHAQRQDAIRAFAADDTQVLVANMKIAGHGLNLQVARRVIFLEADWTPGPNDQAIGRLFRPGQRRPVHATFIGVARSSDMRVAQVVARKRRIITEIIGTGGE